MATYQVTGPAVFPKDQAGKVHAYYTGATLPDGIPAQELERLAGRGLITKVDDPPAAVVVAEADSEPAAIVPPLDASDPGQAQRVERPAQVAPKAAWVNYAVTQGMARIEAEAMTKAELVDAFPPE